MNKSVNRQNARLESQKKPQKAPKCPNKETFSTLFRSLLIDCNRAVFSRSSEASHISVLGKKPPFR